MYTKVTIALLLAIFCFAQCTDRKNALLNPDSLPSQYYTIDINRDTVLHTPNGAIIRIPKGTLQSDNATVRLLVKEAYNVTDMLLAGLSTKAGKEPLSSGGMIYINPADGSKASIIKPISVSVPTAKPRDNMQLYKGQTRPDGSIDWKNPKPIEPPAINDTLARGKTLFVSNCASCHQPSKNATGNPLGFLDKRRDWKYLIGFVHNSSKMIMENDPLACYVYNYHNKIMMTAFPQLSEEEIRAIFAYADYECRNINPSDIPDIKKSFDSCQLYNKLTEKLRREKNGLTVDNGREIKLEVYNNNINLPPLSDTDTQNVRLVMLPPNLVTPADNYATYYQITIQEWGWYNMDILLKGLPGFENSELIVRLKGEYTGEVNIFLIIPSQKIMLRGGPLEGKTDEYGFYTDDGQIPLPQNTKAYILAMGNHNDQLYFAKTDFTTKLEQSFEMQLSAVTKEQMNVEIKKLDFEGLNITAADSKNADSIRKIDVKLKKLDKLKPVFCNCGCNNGEDTASLK